MSTATENCPVGIEQDLDLTFLATGQHQHVFVRTAAEDDPWVYKIPAAFGFVLPFEQPERFFWPESAYEKVLYSLTLSLPRGLDRRMSRWTGKPLGLTRFLRRVGERMAASHCRRNRIRHFQRMLDVIELIADRGLQDLLLPYHIVRHASADLHIDERAVHYEGPLLVQHKAALFEDDVVLPFVHWQHVVEAQHRLWKHGVGVCGCDEMLGIKSWALLGGNVYLADTSATTRNRQTIHNNLAEDMLDKSEARALSALQSEGESVALHLGNMRREINRERFKKLWGQCCSRLKTESDFPGSR